MTTNT